MKIQSINNLEFAVSEQIIADNVDIVDMQRLSNMLILQPTPQHAAKIQYTLAGSAKKYSLPSLHLTIDAKLPVACQRCLNEMSVQLNLKFDYLVTQAEPADYDGNDDLDWLEASQSMLVWELIEDELLIAFPIAPVHPTEHSSTCVQHSMQSGEKPNPFSVLKSLVNKPNA